MRIAIVSLAALFATAIVACSSSDPTPKKDSAAVTAVASDGGTEGGADAAPKADDGGPGAAGEESCELSETSELEVTWSMETSGDESCPELDRDALKHEDGDPADCAPKIDRRACTAKWSCSFTGDGHASATVSGKAEKTEDGVSGEITTKLTRDGATRTCTYHFEAEVK